MSNVCVHNYWHFSMTFVIAFLEFQDLLKTEDWIPSVKTLGLWDLSLFLKIESNVFLEPLTVT